MEDFILTKTPISGTSECDESLDEDCGSPVAGIMMIGIIYSILAAIIAILLGAGFWIVLASYAGGGAFAMVLSGLVVAFNKRHATDAKTQYIQSHTSQKV